MENKQSKLKIIFKGTVDYINVGHGVRLASALTTGFLVCIVSDIQSDDPKAPIGLGQIEGQYITSLTTGSRQIGPRQIGPRQIGPLDNLDAAN